ncbi:MAG: pitrilysin family protein [Paludibacter sp.]|nr:pitrilysin family protein [Paludibacter sp.]
MEYQLYTLPSGLRIVHRQEAIPVCHCGMVIDTGSRDEALHEQGLAHFVEHLLFKGTQKRRSGHIINRLENVGGELNAYTAKEETVVYAAVLNEHMEKAVDLIGDIVFRSTFPEKELEKERVIILDEIQSYNDSPSELIYDEFEELIFDAPLGHAILGTPELLQSYSRTDLLGFVGRNYHPSRMVFYMVGQVSASKLLKMAERYLVPVNTDLTATLRRSPAEYLPSHKELKRDTFQVHYMVGGRAIGLQHPQRMSMYLLNNILGGPGMNSRLNLSLREKHGLVYTVDSVYQPLTDTGMWTVYFGTDASNFRKCERLVLQELRRLREEKIKDSMLKNYKFQLLGQMAIGMEQKENAAMSLGKSILRYEKADSIEHVKELIMAITADQLQDLAQLAFNENEFSSLKYY